MVDLRRPGLPPSPKKPLAAARPTAASSAVLQAAKQRAQAALGKLPANSPIKQTPLFSQFVEVLMSDSAEGHALRKDAISRARQELERRQKLAAPLCELLRPLQARHAQRDLMQSVVRPAYRRQLSSQECADRVAALLQIKTPLLDAIEYLFGPITLTVGGGAEAGAGLGIEGAVGLAFNRRSSVGVVHALTLAAGAYAEASASIQAAISGGVPTAGESITMDVSVSAASGVAGEFLISLTPVLHPPALPEKSKPALAGAKNADDVVAATTRKVFGAKVYSGFVVDYEYAGFSLSMGVGAGLGGAIGVTGSSTFLLPGLAQTK